MELRPAGFMFVTDRKRALRPLHTGHGVSHRKSSPGEEGKQPTGGAWWCVLIMSSRRTRSVANPLESAITTPSERILKECHSLYVDSDNGKRLFNLHLKKKKKSLLHPSYDRAKTNRQANRVPLCN